MSNPLFSTYKQGENRVTSTILAVLERLSFAIVEQILQSVMEEPETKLVSFQNQPQGLDSVPDARIFASFSYWIETKTKINAIGVNQVRKHLAALDDKRFGFSANQRLLILTPDPEMPSALNLFTDDRLVWANFENLVTAIQDAIDIDEDWLSSNDPLPTESERELLRELVQFLTSEKLVGVSRDRVLIVAARLAYPEYLRHGLYFCQPNRSFQPSSHLGFYSGGEVKPEFPRILSFIDSIHLDMKAIEDSELATEEKQPLLSAVGKLDEGEDSRLGNEIKVLFLSEPDAADTISLSKSISNDLVSETGRTIAFTQGQRYVTLEAVRSEPATTTELLHRSNEK